MKYLDYPELESLSRALSFESAECKVFTRIEAYSCKAVKKERQLFKALENQYAQAASTSPPSYLDESLASPFGRLDTPAARKTMFLLIATLNGAFPDHDFTDVNSADFKRENNSDSVLSSLGTTLLSLRSNSNVPRSFSSFPGSYEEATIKGPLASSPTGNTNINHPQLASVLDDIMCISDCEVYSFHPDAESDPHACADLEEEGEMFDDDRYADDEDEVWSDGEGITNTSLSTPRQQHEQLDTPLFDEDIIGTGFTPASSQFSSSQPPTPRTPSISTRARAGDFFTAVSKRSTKPSYLSSSHESGGSSSSYSEEDDDVDGGLHGLLWATYAFFYNRKLKRILFVSVWSRRNASSMSYGFSPPTYPTVSYNQPILHHFTLDDNDEISSGPSPAKRAIAKSTAKSRRRSLSGSPAPSALSPFPHAATVASSPIKRGGSKLANSSPLVQPIQSMSIADTLKSKQQINSDSSSSGRMTGVAKRTVETNAEPSKEQARKQRKVGTTIRPPLVT